MGQQLPLPEKIPFPSNDIQKALIQKGFIIEDTHYERFVHYLLPKGWRVVNNVTFEKDVHWEFIDQNGKVHFVLKGWWQDVEDLFVPNHLQFIQYKESIQFQPVRRLHGWNTAYCREL